ncbi:MAG: arginine--tRNA ligase, partial [Nanoarchaeota archaeon]
PELEQEVLALLKKLEDGDLKVKKEFREIVDTCIKGQKAILSEFGIEFDSFDYESDYLFNKTTEKVLADLKKSNKMFTDEQNRTVLDLKGFKEVEEGMKSPVLVLTRNDGTSLYPLRDLAYSLDKAAWAKGRNILVLGEDQKLYFHQIAAALSFLKAEAPEPVHYSFVLIADGKMSTRKGTVVLLEDFMHEAVEKAKSEILAREPGRKGKEFEALARTIAYGAVKYGILKVSPDKNVTFDWEQALSFEGDSGPYVQYAHARICSILHKAEKGKKPDFGMLTHKAEANLINKLAIFPEIVAQATKQLSPHSIANYAKELAQEFTSFYHECPVLTSEGGMKDARVALCKASKQVLASALELLGIDAPEAM